MSTRVIASTCKECNVRCGSLIHVADGELVKITGNPDHPATQGAFCIKGANGPATARLHPDRPLCPMRRIGERGEGKWERVSWDTALADIADRLGEVKRKYGPTSIAGAVTGPLVSRGVAMALLLRSLGSPNWMINQDQCQGCRVTASMLTGVGAQPGNELARTRCVLVAGKSPSDSSVVEWMHIKAAKKRGAKLIVIDPRRTHAARFADVWLPLKPGTDAALVLAMINVIFDEGLHDDAFIAQWCTDADELRARAAQYPASKAAVITGISADTIRQAARLFAQTGPACITLGHGIDAHANGVATAMAFTALLAITGNIDRIGSNRMPKHLKGFRDLLGIIGDREFRLPADREHQIIGGESYPFWCGPQSWAKTSHNPGVINAIATGEPYPVRALYVSGVNIVCTYPGIQNTIAALKSLDLLVVASDHVTPTAELADYILPKTMLLEEEDVSADSSGACLTFVQRAFEPRGEAKTDIEIAVALRDRLRERGLLDFELLPWNSNRELIDYQLSGTGLRFDEVSAQGFYSYPFEYGDYRSKGFKTPSGKIELASSRLREAGYDPLPDYRMPVYAEPNDGYDLILLTGIRSMAYHHSRFRDHAWARKIQSTPELRIHPDTARSAGIVNDDWVWVETPHGAGRALLQAWITDDVPANVVATGMGWWYPEIKSADHGALVFNIETAIPYGPPWDPVSGSAEARNCACRISRADPREAALYQTDRIQVGA